DMVKLTCSPAINAASEEELQHELHVARLAVTDAGGIASVTGTKDQTIGAACEAAADRIAKVQPVEEVENIRSKLDLIPLLDFEVLENREVYRRETWSVQAVALDRSVSAKRRELERILIEVPHAVDKTAVHGCRLRDALKWITHLVSPVRAVPCVAAVRAG